jgi:membrane fusion protein (multidrug efflux system)
MKIFVSTIILICSLVLAYGLYANKPESRKKKPKISVPVVETMALKKSSERVFLEAYGSVIPAKTLDIRTEVDGRVVSLNSEIVPGGIVQKGDLLVEVDAVTYELYVIELQADVARAEYELELEKGQQVIAKQEWQLLEQEIKSTEASRALALREPHLRQAKIKLEAAKSKLAAAQLDVGRTKLRAPFHALVLKESVEVGQLVNRQTSIITLVDIDTFWVQVSVPFSQLNRIRLPNGDHSQSPEIMVTWEQDNGPDIERSGNLFKLLGDLEPKGRMARLLVTLDDPFNLSETHSGKSCWEVLPK